VDTKAKTIKLGVLTALSGPAEAIGAPLYAGNQAYFKWVNDHGGFGGYKVELEARDNKYDQQETITQYGQIKDDVAAFAQVLGTSPVTAIQQDLKTDNIVASPATLDAPWYADPQLVSFLPPYQIQAISAIDYFINEMGGKGKNVCTINSSDSFGPASLEGVKFGVKALGVPLVDSESFRTGDKDFSAQLVSLQKKKCDFVWVGAGTPEFVGILGQAAGRDFGPVWMSATYSTGLAATELGPYLAKHFVASQVGVGWGDDSSEGMKNMLAAAKAYFPDQRPDPRFIMGWLEAQSVGDVIEKAVKDGDLTREGIRHALDTVGELTFDGMLPDLPYGAPADRQIGQGASFFKVTPETLATNGGLTLQGPEASIYASKAAAEFTIPGVG
jgi:ABC-type branched-subunit amino acid transport system substrate-binding protein